MPTLTIYHRINQALQSVAASTDLYIKYVRWGDVFSVTLKHRNSPYLSRTETEIHHEFDGHATGSYVFTRNWKHCAIIVVDEMDLPSPLFSVGPMRVQGEFVAAPTAASRPEIQTIVNEIRMVTGLVIDLPALVHVWAARPKVAHWWRRERPVFAAAESFTQFTAAGQNGQLRIYTRDSAPEPITSEPLPVLFPIPARGKVFNHVVHSEETELPPVACGNGGYYWVVSVVDGTVISSKDHPEDDLILSGGTYVLFHPYPEND